MWSDYIDSIKKNIMLGTFTTGDTADPFRELAGVHACPGNKYYGAEVGIYVDTDDVLMLSFRLYDWRIKEWVLWEKFNIEWVDSRERAKWLGDVIVGDLIRSACTTEHRIFENIKEKKELFLRALDGEITP